MSPVQDMGISAFPDHIVQEIVRMMRNRKPGLSHRMTLLGVRLKKSKFSLLSNHINLPINFLSAPQVLY